MPHLKLEVEYDGTGFAGWQTQHPRQKQKTIQDIMEGALRQILREPVKLIVAGRTDAGVHALGQVADFHTVSNIALDKLRLGVNALLPAGITVKKIQKAASGFHSRFSAKCKFYRYTIFNHPYPPALSRNFVCHCYFPLDLKLMQQEARVLLGRHDFRAFAAAAAKKRNSLKTVRAIRVSRRNDNIAIDIEADGFLYNMVRNIAGTLIDIGRGRLPAGSMKKILESRERRLAGATAPAGGLCLIKVKY